MYFKSLPKIKYPWKDSTGKFRSAIVPDIFRRIQLDKFFSNRLSLIEVFLNDTDTPESVAYDYYGSTKYHWVILLDRIFSIFYLFIEKEKRKEQARLTRIKEEKELKEKQEAELKARIEQEKVESAKRAEKASNTKKEVIKKVEDKKVVKEEKLDLFGFEIDLVKQGDVVEVEVLEEERENYLVKIKSNFQEAKLPKAELGKDSVKIGDTVKVIVWKFYAEEFYVSVRRLENKEDLASKMSNIKEEDIILIKVIGIRFELNDATISVLGELKHQKQRITKIKVEE